MSRNAFVPMTWITSDLNGEALRTLILISTYANGETGKCNVRNPRLASVLGKSDRSVRNDISEIVKAGFISIENGDSRDRILKIESPEWFHRPGRKTSGLDTHNPEEKLPGQPGRKTSAYPEEKLPRNPEEKLPGPNKNTILEHNFQHSSSSGGVSQELKSAEKATTTTSQNLEPFETESTATLPVVRNVAERFRMRTLEPRPTEFKPETRARMLEVLGTDCEQFARKVTQEQADAGFPDWIMGEAARNKTPGRLAFHLLKTAWREGWIDPKAEEQAKRAARKARLEALR
jgi:hypothetical protein